MVHQSALKTLEIREGREGEGIALGEWDAVARSSTFNDDQHYRTQMESSNGLVCDPD
jgi:hypothetical protein